MARRLVVAASAWGGLLWLAASMVSLAQEGDGAPRPTKVALAEGKLSLTMPPEWKQEKPRVNLVDFEFSVPGEGEAQPARVTIMAAGGSLQANLDRWKGLFEATGREYAVEKREISGQEVHVVTVAGTYLDRPAGPQAQGQVTRREAYRMLGGVLVTKHGRYYVKLYGPQETVAAHEKAFAGVLDSLQVTD